MDHQWANFGFDDYKGIYPGSIKWYTLQQDNNYKNPRNLKTNIHIIGPKLISILLNNSRGHNNPNPRVFPILGFSLINRL